MWSTSLCTYTRNVLKFNLEQVGIHLKMRLVRTWKQPGSANVTRFVDRISEIPRSAIGAVKCAELSRVPTAHRILRPKGPPGRRVGEINLAAIPTARLSRSRSWLPSLNVSPESCPIMSETSLREKVSAGWWNRWLAGWRGWRTRERRESRVWDNVRGLLVPQERSCALSRSGCPVVSRYF